MSQLPSIHSGANRGKPVSGDRGGGSTGADGLASRDGTMNRQLPPLETLRLLCGSGGLSAETKRKLTAVLRSAERERERGAGGGPIDADTSNPSSRRSPECGGGSPASQASNSSSSRHHMSSQHFEMDFAGSRSWMAFATDGYAPQARQIREELLPASEWIRAKNYDVSELPFRGRLAAGTASCAPDSSRRDSPALHDPHDTFEKLNKALTFTMRYVEEVTDLDFDIGAVREYDGSEMEDKERLFLSVCCSAIANFALCTTLNVDLRKLAHFLADIYKYYSAVNSYHNAIHAADSLQMASLFFRDPAVNFLFTDEEILLCFMAVLAMDVAHPGVCITTLAEMNHPLVTVFGDVSAKEQSSLLVFMHQLFLDENFFLNVDSPNHIVVRSRSLLREALYDIVLPGVPRVRPFLVQELSRIAAQRTVRSVDVNRLLCALLVLAGSAFALRSSAMALTWATWWCDEMELEEDERQRQFLRRLFTVSPTAGPAQWAADYCDAVVGSLAEAVRALVPTDLFDNLERNRDLATMQASAASFNATHSDGSRARAPVPFASPAAEDIRNGAPVSPWTDITSDIMDILKKTAAHANSLDRKASRGAILNASPPRSSSAVSKEWRAAAASNAEGRRSSSSSAVLGVSVTSVGTAEEDDGHQGDLPSLVHPSRSEHYFSFLRLYDEFERHGRTLADFAGQLVFLALQLDPAYIATAAREKFGDGCDAATCVTLGAFIRETEEAPVTAEAIATTRVSSSLFFATDDNKGTDSFILYLMEMYEKRETAAAEAVATASLAIGEECDSADISTGTSPPSVDPSVDRRGSLTDASGSAEQTSGPPRLSQRDSPIRMPVGTDTSGLRTAPAAVPLVGAIGSTHKSSPNPTPPHGKPRRGDC